MHFLRNAISIDRPMSNVYLSPEQRRIIINLIKRSKIKNVSKK